MKKLTVAGLLAVAVTAVVPLSVHAGTLQSFSMSKGTASALGFGFTNCTAWSVILDASSTGTHNLSAPATQGFAFVDLEVFNFCTNSDFFVASSTNNIQFTSGPVTTNNVPKFINASGTLTLPGTNCTSSGCSDASDTVTFSIAVQPVSDTTSHIFQHTRKTSPDGVTMEEIRDANSAIGTGTVSVSSQTFGTLTGGTWDTSVNDEKTHMITITFP